MKKYSLSVKEINDYADSIEDKTDIDVKVSEFIDSFGFMLMCNIFEDCLFVSDYPEYIVNIGISDKTGHVVAFIYDRDEYYRYSEDFRKWLESYLPLADCPDVKDKFSFDVPESRGFSDSPNRAQTEVNSQLDMEIAVAEYLHEKDGTQKIYPWMIKELMPASDFGISEEEYDTLLQDTLG